MTNQTGYVIVCCSLTEAVLMRIQFFFSLKQEFIIICDITLHEALSLLEEDEGLEPI